jgi:hypothetical protein
MVKEPGEAHTTPTKEPLSVQALSLAEDQPEIQEALVEKHDKSAKRPQAATVSEEGTTVAMEISTIPTPTEVAAATVQPNNQQQVQNIMPVPQEERPPPVPSNPVPTESQQVVHQQVPVPPQERPPSASPSQSSVELSGETVPNQETGQGDPQADHQASRRAKSERQRQRENVHRRRRRARIRQVQAMEKRAAEAERRAAEREQRAEEMFRAAEEIWLGTDMRYHENQNKMSYQGVPQVHYDQAQYAYRYHVEAYQEQVRYLQGDEEPYYDPKGGYHSQGGWYSG